MKSLRTLLSNGLTQFKADSLYRNAAFLMASTGIMSVLGFGFWIFVAHSYPSADIGTASSLIAITLLISNLSFFGLNSAFIRFLPTSKKASNDINAVLIVVGAAAALAAAIYLLVAGSELTGPLHVFNASLIGRLIFITLLAGVALNTVTDSVFIASRRAEFHTVAYTTFGLLRLILPLYLISLGSLGIFMAYCVAVLASLAMTFVFMRFSSGYRFFRRPNWQFITGTRKYTTNNYVGTLLSGVPAQIMPSLILHWLGAASAAYFAMAWTMSNLLGVVPSAITNSLLAESSHDFSDYGAKVRHASRLLAMILVPAVLLAIAAAPYVLRLFGPEYAAGGTVIFQLLAFSTFSIAGIAIGNTIMNIEQRSHGIVVSQGFIAASTLVLAWYFMQVMHLGLAGAGLAILLGNVVGNLAQYFLLTVPRRHANQLTGRQPTHAVVDQLLTQYGLSGAEVSSDLGVSPRSSTVMVKSGRKKFVLKIYNRRTRSMPQVEAELQFTRYLIDRGIPAPRVRLTNTSSLVSERKSKNGDWIGVLMEFEPGSHPALYSSDLLRNMATIQGRMHLYGIDYAQTGQVNPKILKAGSIRSTLIRYAPKGISHFDYDSGNILVNRDDIACVIDFEGMRYDPLVVCVYFTLAHLYDQLRDPAKIQLYLGAYQQVRPLGRLERLILRSAMLVRFPSLKMATIRF